MLFECVKERETETILTCYLSVTQRETERKRETGTVLSTCYLSVSEGDRPRLSCLHVIQSFGGRQRLGLSCLHVI